MKSIKLLKLEYLKYKDNSLIQMLLLFYTLLMPTSIFMMKNIKIPMLPGAESFFSFPNIWEYQAYAGSWISFFFLGFFGVYIISSEIQFKTMRQNIINGMSRADFFKGKIILSIVISLIATLIFFISTSLIGLSHQDAFDLSEIFEQQNFVVFRFFLLTFAYISFGMLIAYLIKNSGLSMLFYFTYVLIIEPMLRWWLHIKLIGKSSAIFYYPMNAIEDLAPLPLYKYAQNFGPNQDFFLLLDYTTAIGISLISVFAFLGLSYYVFIKKDI